MAKPKPPKIEAHEIPKRPDDELERFLSEVYFRIRNNIKEIHKGKLNHQWVALETLRALYPLLENGADHDAVKNAYPVRNWRENTVEVPIELLGAIVSAWDEYMDSPSKTLGQAFGFEKVNQQGSRPMKAISKEIDKKRRISSRVLIEHVQIGDENAKSREEVVGQIADEFDVSESTVERAYKEFGADTFKTLESLKDLDFIPGKTSRSGDLD